MSTPDGDGYSRQRYVYVGCEFQLANPAYVAEVHAKFPYLNELPPAHEVTFQDLLNGLREGRRFDWAEKLRKLWPPCLVRFPIECAKLIEA